MGRPAHNQGFRNIRPQRVGRKRVPSDITKAYIGAQYSNTIQKWIPFVWDGRMLTMFEPRPTRESSFALARAHKDRIFSTEMPDLEP